MTGTEIEITAKKTSLDLSMAFRSRLDHFVADVAEKGRWRPGLGVLFETFAESCLDRLGDRRPKDLAGLEAMLAEGEPE